MTIIQKLQKFKGKHFDHDKYITTPEFNKLTKENFDERLKQANSANKNDIAELLQIKQNI